MWHRASQSCLSAATCNTVMLCTVVYWCVLCVMLCILCTVVCCCVLCVLFCTVRTVVYCCVLLRAVVYCMYCCVLYALLCTAVYCVYCCVITTLHVLSADSAIASFVSLNQSDLSCSSCKIHTLQTGHQDTWAKSSLNQWVSASRLSLFSRRTRSLMLVGCQLLAVTQLHLT